MNPPLWNPPLTLCWAAIFGDEHRELVEDLRRSGMLVFTGPKRGQDQGERKEDETPNPGG